jgi:hypothetical protein
VAEPYARQPQRPGPTGGHRRDHTAAGHGAEQLLVVGFVPDEGEPAVRPDLADGAVVHAGSVLAWPHDRGRADDGRARDTPQRGERMVGRYREEHLLGVDEPAVQFGFVQWRPDERRVVPAGQQPRDVRRGPAGLGYHLHVRVLGTEPGHQRVDGPTAGGPGVGEPDPAGLPAGGDVDACACGVGVGEQRPGLGGDHRADGGQRAATRPTPHQLRAEFPFQGADLLAERGLREVQPAGGAGEVQLLGEHQEVAQPPQVHEPS